VTRSRKMVFALLAVALSCGAAAACITVGPDNPYVSDGSVGDDGAGGPDGTTDGRKGDGGGGDGATGDANKDAATVYGNLTNAGAWQSFDLAAVDQAAGGFWGAAFDGRYLYLAPSAHHLFVRYDTQGPLDLASSYRSYDLTAVDPNATNFAGAAFDGRYVYLIPHNNGMLVRYDTQQPFGAGIDAIDLTVLLKDMRAQGFAGSTIDPTSGHLYLSPYTNAKMTYDGFVVRYAIGQAFDAGGSYDTAEESSLAGGFFGAAFDGRYVYFIPFYAGGTSSAMDDCVNCCCQTYTWDTFASVALRYDTQANIATPGAFSAVDLRKVNGAANGFTGAVFDGQRYLYYLPYANDGNGSCGCCSCSGMGYVPSSLLLRYDTHGSFGDVEAGAYAAFDMSAVKTDAGTVGGFFSGAFDGRYVYLVSAEGSLVARFDTQGSLGVASFETFDTSKLTPATGKFSGAAFDGRYVYVVPSTGTVLARFDAKNPPSLPAPPAYTGSFF
jgi:hypothetical protein